MPAYKNINAERSEPIMSMDTLFTTHDYNYPLLTQDVRDKISHLCHSIKKLEANLVTTDADSKALNEKLTHKFKIDYISELNPSQLLATTTISGKALVIAGAGSGKTKTLTYRTSYLIENGVSASSILLLTFTRKAANEIKNRAQKLLADTYTYSKNSTNTSGNTISTNDNLVDMSHFSQLTSGTFHSFCNMLLRRYSGLLGINPKFTILDTADSEDAIDLICKENNYAAKNAKQAFPRKKTLQTIISTSRNRRILIRHLVENDYPDIAIHIPVIEKLAEEFHKYKRAHHLYDFDDIISQVVTHLKSNKSFKKAVQDTYRHVMVDEYQDTNIPQKQLIDLICKTDTPYKDSSLMVVGDDNQSIYAFRGANYKNILLFGDTYPDAKLIKLEQNYRSTPAVLDYINALSEQITLGYQKKLFSDLPIAGHKPVFCRQSNEAAEAKFIADTLIELKPELDYNDFAVLCRTSFQSNYIQLEFMERGIPFIVVGGIKFIEKRHIKDILAFVKVLYNPNDTISWHRILTIFKGVGLVTATRLTNAINASNNSLEPLLDPTFNKKNEQLSDLYHILTKASQSETVLVIIEQIIDFYIPILKTLEENWRERAEDFRVLKNLAAEHISMDNFLEHLALDPPNDSVATLDKPELENEDSVTISTIHSAKGLEWSVVFINALVDGLMPHYRSADDFEAMEEERKLFYVACSRAKFRLYLTAPDYFASYSGYFDKVSRFVAEVPTDKVINRETKQSITPENKPQWW